MSYLTGDRMGLQTQIAADAVVRFRRHLEAIGEVESISLFLYTRGGDLNVPWRLVNLLREYCKKLTVLVPFRAHSSGTLISLGADEIVMGKMGELSSVDPSVANDFNPPNPLNAVTRIPISVEDVNAYINLARRFGIQEEDAERNGAVFSALTSKIDPLALGNVERTHRQIKKLVADLLALHPPELGSFKTEEIVEILTVGLFSHSHMIDRRQAKKIGLNVVIPDPTADRLIWKLFSDYSAEMELEKPFNASSVLGAQPTVRVSVKRAFIESIGKTDSFVSEGSITRVQANIQLPPGMQIPPQFLTQPQVAVQFDSEGWREVR